MKKIIYTFIALALATTSARAQFDKSWTFNDWETATITTDTEKDGLTAYATSGNTVVIEENKKSIDIEGVKVNFTKRLNLRGVEQADARYISFDVTGPSEITMVYCGATSTNTNRVLNISYGETHNMKNLHSMIVPAKGVLTASTVKYELDEPTTIYVGSGNSGVYLFGVYVKSIDLAVSEVSTPKLSWNFKQVISDADVENLTADAETWKGSVSTFFQYKPYFTADQASDRLYGITLSANGNELEYVKGLCFGRPNGAIGEAGKENDRFCLYSKKNLLIKGTDIGFIIPELKRGDIVKVNFSCNGTTASTLKPTNAVLISGELLSTTSQTVNEATFRVLSDGYVGFRGTAAIKYFSLSVNDDIVPTAYQLIAEDTDFYSIYMNYDAIIPDGVTAYTAALDAEGTSVELTPVTGKVLKRNCGYIVNGNSADTFSFEVSDIMGDEIDGNELSGVLTETMAADIEAANPGKTLITLGLLNGKMGFRKPAGGKLGDHKAYLLVDTPEGSNAPAYSIKVNGGTTTIGSINVAVVDENAPMYNIAGQRVGRDYKGIVIQNGRKVIK